MRRTKCYRRSWMRRRPGTAERGHSDGGKAIKTLAALAATLAILSGCEDAEPPAPLVPFGPNWIAVENQRCQMYNPNPDPGDTVTWSGTCVDGKTSGRGRAVWRYSAGGEDVFKGEHRAGKAHGHGVYIWSGDRHGASSTPIGIPPFVREDRDEGDRYDVSLIYWALVAMWLSV